MTVDLVERLFCSLKEDVEAYIRYYNQIRLHTSNGDCSPIEFEQSTINVSYASLYKRSAAARPMPLEAPVKKTVLIAMFYLYLVIIVKSKA